MGAQPRFYSTFSTSSTVQLLICIISEHWLLPADSMSVMLCSFGSLFEPFQRILPSHLAGGGQFCWVYHRVCLFCGWISMLNFGDSKWADFWHSANQQHQLIEIMETFWAEVAILFSNPLNSTSPQRVLHHTSWPILVPETLGIARLPSSSLLASVPKISWPDLPVAVPQFQNLKRAGEWRATSANNYFGNLY